MFRAPQWHDATQTHFHQGRANPQGTGERFVRDFLQKSRVQSPKVCKTSVSRETFSKSHTSSLQNERFARDFLKNSHVKVCAMSVSCETAQKSSGNTHRSADIPAPPNNTRSHANPNVTATFTSTTTHNLTIPCAATKLAVHTLTRTKHCACHEMSPPSRLATSRFPAPATKIALPHLKARTKYCACHEKCQYHIMGASTKFAPHRTFGMISARSEHTRSHPPKSPFQLRLVTKTDLGPETQTPMARPHPTPQKHHSPNANPSGTAQKTADLTKCCAVKSSHFNILHVHVFPRYFTRI